MKRLLAILLCVLMLVSSFSLFSCKKEEEKSGSGDDEAVTTVEHAVKEENKDLFADLPTGSYDDYVFSILNATNDYGLYMMDSLTAVDAVETAVYNRNRFIEESLGMKFAVVEDTYQRVRSTMRNITVGSGEYLYDLCYNQSRAQATLAMEGVYVSVNDYSEMINLSKPWWYDKTVKDLTICNNAYMIAGDMNMVWNDSIWCMSFNKDILRNHQCADPYALVQEGKWTFEALHQMTLETKIEGATEPRYGVTSHIGFASALMVAGGVEIVVADENKGLVFDDKNQRIIDVYESALNYFFKSNGQGMDHYIRTHYESASYMGGNFPSLDFQGIYTQANAVFMGGTVGDMRTYLPSSEINYGIVPMPKYNEEQEQYIGSIFTGGHLAAIPVTVPDEDALQRTCTILEWLCAYSYEMFRPVYYDIVLHGRTANDPESAKMLDIVFGYHELGTTLIELDAIYSLGTDIIVQLRISDASTAIKSAMASQKVALGKTLGDLVDYYRDHGGY